MSGNNLSGDILLFGTVLQVKYPPCSVVLVLALMKITDALKHTNFVAVQLELKIC